MASGESMVDISYLRIGHTTVSKLILESCTALWDTLEKTTIYLIRLVYTFTAAAFR